jgi:hypothetical protein
MYVLGIVLIIVALILVCIATTDEGFNDTCTTLERGDTDAIRLDRAHGRRAYRAAAAADVRPEASFRGGNSRDAPANKKMMSGGGTVGNVIIERDGPPSRSEEQLAKIMEGYQDYSLASGEDAAGRTGAEFSGTNYGLSGTMPRPRSGEWSGEQLMRVYGGDLCRGDQRIVEKMKDSSMHAQQAIINRASFNKNSLLPFVGEELAANENSEWWVDNQDLEARMQKDGMALNDFYCAQC